MRKRKRPYAVSLFFLDWRTIACCLVKTVRKNATIDWTQRENMHTNLRRLVKRILRDYGYPLEMVDRAMVTILEQAEVFSDKVP